MRLFQRCSTPKESIMDWCKQTGQSEDSIASLMKHICNHAFIVDDYCAEAAATDDSSLVYSNNFIDPNAENATENAIEAAPPPKKKSRSNEGQDIPERKVIQILLML